MIFKESHLDAMKYLHSKNELNKENIKQLIYNYSVQTDKFILILDLHKLL
jgi:ribonucleotide reductase alpha subunit